MKGDNKTWMVAAAGLLVLVLATAAYGWPALMRRRQSADAMSILGRIAKRAHVYYVKPRQGTGAERAPCQFPIGEIRSTPALSCCDERVRAEGSNHCDPAKTDWERLLWRALEIEVKEPQGFVYSYEGSGSFGDARYKVTAIGDLDCDGVYSTYVYEGRGDPKATKDNCVLETHPTFRAVNPGE
ncbi:MAG: hypothetical protein KC502_03295 [Myxococcales bacterium]|nr:hypothetical protein [Myxococcales bacterium]